MSLDTYVDRVLNSLASPFKDIDYDLSRLSQKAELNRGPMTLVEGTVVGTTAYVHNYRVQLENRVGAVNATLVTDSSMNLVGAKVTNTLSVGSRVLCSWREGMKRAYIVGSIPYQTQDTVDGISDTTVPAGTTGLNRDKYSRGPFVINELLSVPGAVGAAADLDQTDAVDESSGRPFDSINVGEVGSMAETGLGFHNDPFLIFMRVNEETGVFGFFANNYLRVAGHNLEVTSSARCRYDTNSSNKTSSEEGFSPYLWESSGIGDPCNENGFRELDAQTVQLDTYPYYYYIEPISDSQQPFYRHTKYHGYLAGGGEKVLQTSWPKDVAIFDYKDNTIVPGQFEQQVLGSGRLITRSASGIIIAKNPRIAVPKRIAPPFTSETEVVERKLRTALDADSGPGNIFCGSGSGSSASSPSNNSGSGNPSVDPQWRAGAYIDQIAYSFNYEAVQPFLEQPSLFYVPEESELTTSEVPPSYINLISKHTLDAPSPVSVKIDGKYGTASYYPNNSYMAFLEDGGIVLVDGWGSEVKMVGGNVYISCGGDIFNMPGKNVNIMAGYDAIIRANNSIDITSSNKDVRVKAENNLMMLGGNDSCGGILIESKTPTPEYKFNQAGEDATVTGVVIKAKKGQIVGLAQDIYMSSELFIFDDEYTNVPDPVKPAGSGSGSGSGSDSGSSSGSGSGSTKPSQFIVNVGEKGKIKLYGKGIERSATQYMLDVVENYVAMEIANGTIYIGYDIGVFGSVVATQNVVAGNWLYAKEHVATLKASDYCFEVFDYVDERVDKGMTRIVEAIDKANTYWQDTYDEGIYDHLFKAAGNVYAAHFSLRTDEQYKTSEFVLYESRWQQVAREANQSNYLGTWNEPPVLSNDLSATFPYPGYTAWVGTECGRFVQPKLHKAMLGTDVDRTDTGYAEGGFSESQKYKLDGNYTVIVSV